MINNKLSIQPIPMYEQSILFDVEYSGNIKSPGQARTSSGTRIEDFVCTSMDLIRIPLNGSYDVNFDAGVRFKQSDVFIEIKSLRKGGKSPLYVWRLNKELKAQKQIGTPVIYIFCIHKIKSAKTQKDITDGLIGNKVSICVVTLNEVNKWVNGLPIRVVKTDGNTNGYNRYGYDQGYYNLPEKKISSMCKFKITKIVQVLNTKIDLDIFYSKNIPISVKNWLNK